MTVPPDLTPAEVWERAAEIRACMVAAVADAARIERRWWTTRDDERRHAELVAFIDALRADLDALIARVGVVVVNPH